MLDQETKQVKKTLPTHLPSPITYNQIGAIIPSLILGNKEYEKWFYSNYDSSYV